MKTNYFETNKNTDPTREFNVKLDCTFKFRKSRIVMTDIDTGEILIDGTAREVIPYLIKMLKKSSDLEY